MSIKIDDFLETVSCELEEYAGEVAAGLKKSIKTVAKETVREVKKNSPTDTGEYKKSWGQTTVRETSGSLVISVHNRKHYRLTHLLENGHALVGGGRTRAQPHIAPAEKFAERELWRKIEIEVRG